MQSLQLLNESIVEIATFLIRRWAERENITVEFSNKVETRTRLQDNRVILTPIEKRIGNDFQRYRQFRTSLWYEAMRIKFCKKILSNDHAFGFILNTMETRRVEQLGRKLWRGMDEEIIFNYAYMLVSRPLLHSVYGKARIVEAFYQYFMFGTIRGEIQSSQFERIKNADKFAKKIVLESIEKNYDTEWLEKNVTEIIKILDIDSLLTIPVSLPFMKAGMAISEEELMKFLTVISKNKEGDFGKIDTKAILRGDSIYDEYKVILDEKKKNDNKGLTSESIGIQIPTITNVDETTIYDLNLINNLKTKFRELKSGWKEQHFISGDEFDEENYIEGHDPFFIDIKKSIKTKIVILLDHSSSIASDALEYKKATLALCEVLAYLKVKFAIYAFNTHNRNVVCWSIKPDNMKWNNASAKRLAQIDANGSTPLAEVYDKMLPILQSKRPDIFLTLTDGEPSDPDAVRAITKSLKNLGIKMVALGLGSNTVRATIIANNLKHLGYENTLAASRLKDIPNKVIRILES
ncbi:vWA domain-containing protein [Candidatus Nitrosarchaeum limnium]|jgi:Mg-chelatase subunit ChlD|uniref:von Willebrand factor type A domain protein n=1 Tax=Candidatus Nitrosarchaeum limnium BG20 TaxID=859192 RepID=S2EQ27_9ARCH|nr:vWA domain-containing protein [Candidatus Nitrosarchaeum limnium]EPA04559.1 von Willebrand factor type A domain protein [Candidatus Nitrosarchaeum limnium BG20]